MIKGIKALYRFIFPKSFRIFARDQFAKIKFIKLRKEVLIFFENNGTENEEQKTVYDYLKKNPIYIYPYEFRKNYDKKDIIVYKDEKNGLNYVLHEKKRLYFKRSMSAARIKTIYNFLRIEQDRDSPHRYLTDTFDVEEGAIIVDAGTAEGNFALSVIEKAKKVYLIEPEPDWIEPLEATFEPWKEKVEIVNKFVSNKTEGQFISLDTLLKDVSVTLVKMDIEGAEMELLDGMKELMSRQAYMKIIACAYHRQNDERDISDFFIKNGFKIETSKGYMFFLSDDLHPPYLRKGLIRAVRD